MSRPHYFYRRGYNAQAMTQLNAQFNVIVGRLDLTLEQAAKQIGVSRSVLSKLAQELSLSDESAQKIGSWIEQNSSVELLQAVG